MSAIQDVALDLKLHEITSKKDFMTGVKSCEDVYTYCNEYVSLLKNKSIYYLGKGSCIPDLLINTSVDDIVSLTGNFNIRVIMNDERGSELYEIRLATESDKKKFGLVFMPKNSFVVTSICPFTDVERVKCGVTKQQEKYLPKNIVFNQEVFYQSSKLLQNLIDTINNDSFVNGKKRADFETQSDFYKYVVNDTTALSNTLISLTRDRRFCKKVIKHSPKLTEKEQICVDMVKTDIAHIICMYFDLISSACVTYLFKDTIFMYPITMDSLRKTFRTRDKNLSTGRKDYMATIVHKHQRKSVINVESHYRGIHESNPIVMNDREFRLSLGWVDFPEVYFQSKRGIKRLNRDMNELPCLTDCVIPNDYKIITEED